MTNTIPAEFADFLFNTSEQRREWNHLWQQAWHVLPKPCYRWVAAGDLWVLQNAVQLCAAGLLGNWPLVMKPARRPLNHWRESGPVWRDRERWPGADWHRMDGFAGRVDAQGRYGL